MATGWIRGETTGSVMWSGGIHLGNWGAQLTAVLYPQTLSYNSSFGLRTDSEPQCKPTLASQVVQSSVSLWSHFRQWTYLVTFKDPEFLSPPHLPHDSDLGPIRILKLSLGQRVRGLCFPLADVYTQAFDPCDGSMWFRSGKWNFAGSTEKHFCFSLNIYRCPWCCAHLFFCLECANGAFALTTIS